MSTEAAGGIDGEVCSECIVVAPGQTILGSTVNAGQGQPTSCGGGEDLVDMWHCFRVPCAGTAKISLCGAETTFNTTLAAFAACDGNELKCDDDGCTAPAAGPSQLEIQVARGETYFLRVAGFGGSTGRYQLDVDLTCCVDCPAGSVLENEPNCGLPVDTTNGGCNTPPTVAPQFTRILCGQTFCGTAASDGQTRDTDWYEVAVATTTEFTWAVSSEFPAAIGLVEMFNPGSGDCADTTGVLNPFAQLAACSSGSVTACLPPGKHWFFVAPVVPAQTLDCGESYTARLTCTECTEACCDSNGECRDVAPDACTANQGTPMGPGTVCDFNAFCAGPGSGACCFGDQCAILPPDTCQAKQGLYLGDGVACVPSVCLGQCCLKDAGCDVTDVQKCFSEFGGIFWVPGGSCDPNTCPPTGACCLAEGCIETARDLCIELYLGRFIDEGTDCSLDICLLPPEACCLPDGRCADIDPARCRDAGGEPGGTGSTCAGDNNGNNIDDFCEDEPCGECGPGPHWMHQPPCPPGTDQIPTGAVVGIDVNLDCEVDTNLVLQGPAAVRRTGPMDDSVQYPGTRPTDGHLDVIDTEMVALSLTGGGGVTLTAGGGLGLGGVLRRTLGAMAEQPADPALAESFFDVFFEVDMGGGVRLYNQTALRVSAVIDCIPPRAIYVHPDQCVELYTSPIPGEGVHVANLVSANHFTFPSCCFGNQCVKDVPTQVCLAEGGSIVPECLDDGNGNGIDDACECRPTVDGSACQQAVCLNRIGQCVPRCATYNPFTGQTVVRECDCIEAGQCHLRVSPGAEPTCDGECTQNEVCSTVRTPNPDGTLTLCCACAPAPTQACCRPDGRCAEVEPLQCEAAGGEPSGTGSTCAGDNNGNNIDDFCEDEPCGECGPGPHWMHQPPCPPGTDQIPTGAVVGIDVNLDCTVDTNLVLQGPSAVRRSGPMDDSAQYPGTRPTDGHLDVIDTEMVSLSLTGGGVMLTAGGGLGQGGVLRRTLGAMAEQPSDPALADSFFDVFFEVDLGGGVRLYNQTALRVSAVIDCIPPQTIYVHPDQCVELYTSPIPGQGVHVANLVSANHSTFPQPPQACCRPDGRCVDVEPLQCEAAGGEPGGTGSTCAGDNNGNNIDDFCEDEPCGECGPGPHWMHQPPCPPGTDQIPTGAVVGIDVNLDCTVDTNLVLQGPSAVRRSGPMDDSVQYPGTRPTDGHLDVIDTEMVSLSLTGGGGVTLTAGGGLGLGGVLRRTLGAMAEQPSDPALADSFFDVFFEVDLGGGVRLYNQTALRVSAVIDCIPPQTIYVHPDQCVELYTSPIPGQGVHVANLVSANHSTFPQPPRACCLVDRGCQFVPPELCRALGGRPQGPGTTCENTNCPVVEVDEFPATTAVMVLQLPEGGGNVPISLQGPTTVHVFFEGDAEGAADDDNGNGLDEVQTEMVDMQLMGDSPFGPVLVRLHPSKPSQGLIEESANTQAGRLDLPPFAPDGTADSFFDVYFEIEVAGRTFHTQQPKRMRSVITHKPPAPGNTYENPDKIPLLDEDGNPTGFSIGPGFHVPRPTCGSPGTGDCFEPHPSPFCNNGDCCELICTLVPQCCVNGWNALCAALARDLCEPTQACCLPNGRCKDVTAALCELGGGEVQGAQSTCALVECPHAGDCNRDGRTDLRDVATFMTCYTAEVGSVPAECHCADLDLDDDVDVRDWRAFLWALTGP